MFEMALNSFVISEINLYQSYLKASIKNKYQSRLNFCGESKSRLEIKEFPVDMPFPGEGVWLVNWVLEGGIGGSPTHCTD